MKQGNKWTKDAVEQEIRRMGLEPAERYESKLGHVFIADGFRYDCYPAWASCGIGPNDFPMGAHCTFWFTATDDEHVDAAVPMFIDPMHTCETSGGIIAGGYDKATMRQARINKALVEATAFLKALDQVRKSGVANGIAI